jgi:NAD(P)-dependent dehydrogenase (short-subunit alcohol dehydrogenase family)
MGDMYTNGEVALVAGAGGGTGMSVCRALAETGLRVIVTDLDGVRAQTVSDVLNAEGHSAAAARLDVTDRVAVDGVVEGMGDGSLAVVVNLAGDLHNKKVINLDNEAFMQTLSTHLMGTVNTTRAVAKPMIAAGYGRIVNMSSIVVAGAVGAAAYAAAKGGVEAFTRTAALEFAEYGITVNSVASGPLETGMFMSQPEERRRQIVESIPMKRAGRPEEMAAAVAFLASPNAGFITGQALVTCGGLSLGF